MPGGSLAGLAAGFCMALNSLYPPCNFQMSLDFHLELPLGFGEGSSESQNCTFLTDTSLSLEMSEQTPESETGRGEDLNPVRYFQVEPVCGGGLVVFSKAGVRLFILGVGRKMKLAVAGNAL